ncbi:MAG: MoaD/ThiS family protein [Nitrososphaerota archaeon]
MRVKVSILGVSSKPHSIILTLDCSEASIVELVKALADCVEEPLGREVRDALESPTYVAIVEGTAIPRDRWDNQSVKDGDEIIFMPMLVSGG